jgi:hypothetical protein
MVHRPFIFAVLLTGIFLVPAVRAQPAMRNGDNRFLLIFDTSSDMKRRLPAVQKALNDILAASTNGLLYPGDSIGVWTFDQDLRRGQFPLQHWDSDNGAGIASDINAFIGKQRYAKTTSFDALLPLLNRVVQDSERLTALIFCDGKGEIHGTPYDVGINQEIFQQRQSEREKARLPIIIGLRSQRGQYVGCMVSFPPQPVSLPQFPPLPPPPAPPVPPPASPPPVRSVAVPPLIIVGTTITNHVPPAAPKPVPAKPPPMVITSTPEPIVTNVTNEVKPPIVVPLMETSAVPVQPKIAAAPLTTTNVIAAPIAPPLESSNTGHNGALVVGAAFLAAVSALAGGLVVFMFRRARKPGGDNPGDGSMKTD